MYLHTPFSLYLNMAPSAQICVGEVCHRSRKLEHEVRTFLLAASSFFPEEMKGQIIYFLRQKKIYEKGNTREQKRMGSKGAATNWHRRPGCIQFRRRYHRLWSVRGFPPGKFRENWNRSILRFKPGSKKERAGSKRGEPNDLEKEERDKGDGDDTAEERRKGRKEDEGIRRQWEYRRRRLGNKRETCWE